jgi:hypothetical protein
MKNFSLLIFATVAFLVSCKKDEVPTPPRPDEVLVTYEVITSSGTWFGEYYKYNGERGYTSPPGSPGDPFVPTPSPWRYSFKPASRPMYIYCHGTSTCICSGTPTSPDVTVNLYVDGRIVASETNNWAKGVTSALYWLQ